MLFVCLCETAVTARNPRGGRPGPRSGSPTYSQVREVWSYYTNIIELLRNIMRGIQLHVPLHYLEFFRPAVVAPAPVAPAAATPRVVTGDRLPLPKYFLLLLGLL